MYIHLHSFCLILQSELQEAKDDLHEKVQLVETRDAELRMLNEKLVDSEMQLKHEKQMKEVGWKTLQEDYQKVHRSFFTLSILLLYVSGLDVAHCVHYITSKKVIDEKDKLTRELLLEREENNELKVHTMQNVVLRA